MVHFRDRAREREMLQKEHSLNTWTGTGRSLIPESGKKKHLEMVKYNLLGPDSAGIKISACLMNSVEKISM